MGTREMARALGQRGGRARAKRLSADERRRIAALGGQARHRTRQVAQRVEENLRYAAAVVELQGKGPKVTRMKTFTGPLPGIYPERSPHAGHRVTS